MSSPSRTLLWTVSRVTGVLSGDKWAGSIFTGDSRFKWLHLLNTCVTPRNHDRGLGGTHGKLTLVGMVEWQTLKVMEPPSSLSPPLLPHAPNSPHPPSQYRCIPPRALTGRRGVNAFMDMLRVPNDKHKLIWMLIYSLSAHSLLNPHRLCKTINSKGTLRSGLYTLFILGNDKSLWCSGFFFYFEARNTAPNKYITAHQVVGVKEKRLTEQHETTSGQIHHGDLSKEMDPRFCPLPSYSAFQLMFCLSPSSFQQ